MLEKFKYLLKNVGVLAISQFSSKILVFFMLPLYTNILSTEQYGIYDLAITLAELLFPILTINIVDAVMRFLLDKKYKQSDVISIAFKYVTIGIAASAVLTLIVMIFGLVPSIAGLELYVFAYFVVYVLHNFAVQVAKGLDKVKDIGIAGVLGTLCTIGFNLLFLLVFFSMELQGFFLASILSQAITTVYLLLRARFWRYVTPNTARSTASEMIRYCLPLIVNTLVWWANSAANKFVVTFFLGAAANGILSVAYKIPNMLSTVQGIFNQGWQISAIKEYNESGDLSFFSKIVLMINGVMFIGASFLILITEPIARFLFAKDFYDAWIYVPLLVLAVVINTNSGIYGAILSAKKKSVGMAVTSLVGIIANIGMNVLFVWLLGIQGAAIATVLSGLIILILRKIISGAEFRTKWDKFVYISLALVSVQSLVKVYASFNTLIIELLIVLLITAMYSILFVRDMKKKVTK